MQVMDSSLIVYGTFVIILFFQVFSILIIYIFSHNYFEMSSTFFKKFQPYRKVLCIQLLFRKFRYFPNSHKAEPPATSDNYF